MVEFPDVEERKRKLAELIGIERQVWVEIHGFAKVYPIANEDLSRETTDKTSSVHFLRFELTPDMVVAARDATPLSMGIDHPVYQYSMEVPLETRRALATDLA